MAFGTTVIWPALRPPAASWLWGPRADLFWIAGGGFFLFSAIAIPFSFYGPSGGLLTALFLHLGIVCNYPHYIATYQVIVRERAARPRDFAKLLVSTPVMIGVLVAGGIWPDLFWSPLLRLYLTWSAHHYAAQNFGLAAMYSARFGRPLEAREKLPLQAAFLGLGAFMMIMANTQGGDPESAARVVGLAENGGDIPIAGFPAWVYYPALAMVVASLGAFATSDRRLATRTGRGHEWATWLLLATTFAWFVVPNVRIGGESWMSPNLLICLLGAPPFFHCAQYLATTFHRSRASGDVRPIWLMAGLVAGGLVLFHGPVPVIPWLLPIDPLRGLLLLFAVINLHHFWMDGLMWRRARRTPSVPTPSTTPCTTPSPTPVTTSDFG